MRLDVAAQYLSGLGLLGLGLLGLGLLGPVVVSLGSAAQDDSRANQRRAAVALTDAIDAHGGMERLRGVHTIRLKEVGSHQWVYQSARADPPWRRGAREEITVLDRRAQRLLIRTAVTHPTYYSGWPGTIVIGTSGYTLDHYSRMMVPIPITSIDAYRSHLYQRLPHEILLDAHARGASLRHLGPSRVAGRTQDVVTYVGADARQTALYFDAATHLLTQYEVVFTDPVTGDSVTGVRFGGYREVDGLQAPATREQFRGTDWIIRTEYREIDFNTEIDPSEFEPPDGYARVEPQPTPTPQITELAPGVFFLSGLGNAGRYNILFLTFTDHIIVINAPAPVAATEDAIARVTERFPDKPIRAVVLTHPAYDHIAGVRAFVARGITVLAAAQTRALVDRIVRAPFTIEPDALARTQRPVRVQPITGRHVLDDGVQRLELIDIGPDETGDDVLIAYVPAAALAFQADLVNPNYAGVLGRAQPASVRLERRLTELALPVASIVGGHGGIVTREQLRQSISR